MPWRKRSRSTDGFMGKISFKFVFHVSFYGCPILFELSSIQRTSHLLALCMSFLFNQRVHIKIYSKSLDLSLSISLSCMPVSLTALILTLSSVGLEAQLLPVSSYITLGLWGLVVHERCASCSTLRRLVACFSCYISRSPPNELYHKRPVLVPHAYTLLTIYLHSPLV